MINLTYNRVYKFRVQICGKEKGTKGRASAVMGRMQEEIIMMASTIDNAILKHILGNINTTEWHLVCRGGSVGGRLEVAPG